MKFILFIILTSIIQSLIEISDNKKILDFLLKYDMGKDLSDFKKIKNRLETFWVLNTSEIYKQKEKDERFFFMIEDKRSENSKMFLEKELEKYLSLRENGIFLELLDYLYTKRKIVLVVESYKMVLPMNNFRFYEINDNDKINAFIQFLNLINSIDNREKFTCTMTERSIGILENPFRIRVISPSVFTENEESCKKMDNFLYNHPEKYDLNYPDPKMKSYLLWRVLIIFLVLDNGHSRYNISITKDEFNKYSSINRKNFTGFRILSINLNRSKITTIIINFLDYHVNKAIFTFENFIEFVELNRNI